MQEITSITNNARQRMQILLDDGDKIDFFIYFYGSQYSWYYDFSYNNYVSKGNKVVLTPNSIRHLRNILPFGISFVADNMTVEPYSVEDFSTGRVKMYILSKDEVEQVEEEYYAY